MSENPIDAYSNNPLIHEDRRRGRDGSEWQRSFDCEDMSVLIVCRGPIRFEAITVFKEMGMKKVGILLSEKDSIVYPRALAPELRILEDEVVHRVSDYSGATKEERVERIEQMIAICRDHGYGYIFAGYGFMAEDEDFVRTLEEAGINFVGPCSRTVNAAGRKDEAKRTALENDVSVTPGVNNATARVLLGKHADHAGLAKLCKEHSLDVAEVSDTSLDLDVVAEAVLDASYAAGLDLYTVDELGAQIEKEVAQMLSEYSGNRVRLKAIGGGGGKGQRITNDASQAPAMVREILNEVKATGVGDNKNILVELNIEQTRHNEIQLLGNGEWCISLGGRDCSLQMHEQKLLEVSITQEGITAAAKRNREQGRDKAADVLEEDVQVLAKMEAEAERFGVAVGLDSASTFECIVDGNKHFFMEVNTRIQVEHRVSELCYALKFTNPDDASDFFIVNSLVEMMALLAKHKQSLPRPERVGRDNAAVEARLNATDRSLSPHAGGEIIYWSDPIDGEIRDDQGICVKNPDTDLFVRYKLAGAYDSNIALLLSTGDDREHSYERLSEILRSTSLRGKDLATNLEFHYGLVHWFLGNGIDAKPTTRFVVPYLTLVGQLREQANSIDLGFAYGEITKRRLAALKGADEAIVGATREALALKHTFLVRALQLLLDEPHYLSAWLSAHKHAFEIVDGRVKWSMNPIQALADTYHLLHMDDNPRAPAAHRIWDHDQDLLDQALAFYASLNDTAGELSWQELDAKLASDAPSFGFDAETWAKVRAAHVGFQLGLELLDILPRLADKAGFFDLKVNEDLTITIPERLFDADLQKKMKKVLVPPPQSSADEIVAASGGMYYAQEAPGLPHFVEKGKHFDIGDPLYIIEVMKMFNKVYATFAGTIDEIIVPEGDAVIVSKGQQLFKVTPDEKPDVVDPAEQAKQTQANTLALLG